MDVAWGAHLHDRWRRVWVAAPADGKVQVLWVTVGREGWNSLTWHAAWNSTRDANG